MTAAPQARPEAEAQERAVKAGRARVARQVEAEALPGLAALARAAPAVAVEQGWLPMVAPAAELATAAQPAPCRSARRAPRPASASPACAQLSSAWARASARRTARSDRETCVRRAPRATCRAMPPASASR